LEKKYSHLLVNYCLKISPGDRVLIKTSTLGVSLAERVHADVIRLGGIPIIQISTSQIERQVIESGSQSIWSEAHRSYERAVNNFEAILTIAAPENSRALASIPSQVMEEYTLFGTTTKRLFMERSGTGALRWALCLYPTPSLAQDAGMSTNEFTEFLVKACGLDLDDPAQYWLNISEKQSRIVDFLNKKHSIRYRSDDLDITFSVSGRRWINSDGRRNMPSGEVFTSPVETSVNGYVYFDFPVLYEGTEISGVRFEVNDGTIVNYSASTGGDALERIMAIPGARHFGEVAIGTNQNIQRHIKNILFDEKIGGTIHMAIGASYPETGGTNQSAIHLDFIADMRKSGEIYADGELIFRNGEFIFP